jgi:hypothetical protein
MRGQNDRQDLSIHEATLGAAGCEVIRAEKRSGLPRKAVRNCAPCSISCAKATR